MTPRPSRSLLGPVGLVLIGILSVQLGAAIAKGLFGEISPTAMVWLRLVTSALVLAAVARPRFTGRSRHDWLVVLGFGLSLATMNWAIYQSFSRIPLGIAVTIEFIGPLTLAVVGSRHARDVVWVLLAGLGVVLLGFERTSRLVTGGAFRYIRHPMYAALLALAWGAYLKHITPQSSVLVAGASLFLLLTALRDEVECRTHFGADYAAYMRRSKRFIPFVF